MGECVIRNGVEFLLYKDQGVKSTKVYICWKKALSFLQHQSVLFMTFSLSNLHVDVFSSYFAHPLSAFMMRKIFFCEN